MLLEHEVIKIMLRRTREIVPAVVADEDVDWSP